MEPALDVINRSLHGDAGARAFLERTSSIYVLDVTDKSNPKTYGCWNFIHQAMNEVERYEARYLQNNQTSAMLNGASLVSHLRLLAAMAMRVARRTPASDSALVATCIANAAEYNGSDKQSQWLIDLNNELREIVMGRIAAMAFDFSFHRKSGPNGHSSFADRVVMDSFCAILSANAVSSGPQAIQHFATEWIIPSSRTLPAYSVASVVLHLASEGMRKVSPAGTKDVLQDLSVPVMSHVLVPSLAEAICDDSNQVSDNTSPHQESSEVAAMCLKAMKSWCDATDLSLPQMKHICGKVELNIVSVISDAMYSDVPSVIDSLAEFIESTVVFTDERVMSEGRMNQVRRIIQVDEVAFKARFSSEQLKTIEAKEMELIVGELVSAIGLQRFRFSERQAKGDHEVCRNLIRIAAAICDTWLSTLTHGVVNTPDTSLVGLLAKGAAHPSIHICGLALEVLVRLIRQASFLGKDMLPILQRRAIIPHHFNSGKLTLAAADTCGVTFLEYLRFREDVLAEALVACWAEDHYHYMESCTSAIEEFCSEQSSATVSLQLEAALYCIEATSCVAIGSQSVFPNSPHMSRVVAALSNKPVALSSTALTLGRMCSFLDKYSEWLVQESKMGQAVDLVVATIRRSLDQRAFEMTMTREELEENSINPISDAAQALLTFMRRSPNQFADDSLFFKLMDVWENIYMACDSNELAIAIDDRIIICRGISHVIASLTGNKRIDRFHRLAEFPLSRLESISMFVRNSDSSTEESSESLLKYANQLTILSIMIRGLSITLGTDGMESGCTTSPDRRARIPEPALTLIRRVWTTVVQMASNHSSHEKVASASTLFICELLPPVCQDEESLSLVKDLCSIATTMSNKSSDVSIVDFVDHYLDFYGTVVEKVALRVVQGTGVSDEEREIGRLLEDLILALILNNKNFLGSVWLSPREQGQGQPAFESKPMPTRKPPPSPNDSLAHILPLIQKCVDLCPVFLLHLPAGPGVDRDHDLMLRRAADSAAASLHDTKPAIVACSVQFWLSLIKHAPSENESMRSFVADALSRSRADMINSLLHGVCGYYLSNTIPLISELLAALLQTTSPGEAESLVTTALQREYFQLGDPAKNIALMVLGRCMSRQLSVVDLALFLEDVRELHQIEETDTLPMSDSVVRFLRKYA